LPDASNTLDQLKTAARAFEARVGPWPLWKKSLVLIPIFLVLSSALVVVLYAIGSGLPVLQKAIQGH
jgi:hypothetical protein